MQQILTSGINRFTVVFETIATNVHWTGIPVKACTFHASATRTTACLCGQGSDLPGDGRVQGRRRGAVQQLRVSALGACRQRAQPQRLRVARRPPAPPAAAELGRVAAANRRRRVVPSAAHGV